MLDKMPAGQGLDVMAAILPHLTAILKDDEFGRIQADVSKDSARKVNEVSQDVFPVIACKHRADVFAIVASVMDKTVAEVEAMPLEEALSVFRGVIGSRCLDFFTFCARMVAKM